MTVKKLKLDPLRVRQIAAVTGHSEKVMVRHALLSEEPRALVAAAA